MSEERSERCETCKFWEQYPDIYLYGECHRMPPFRNDHSSLLSDGGSVNYGLWPDTESSDWCGEWKPKMPLPMVETDERKWMPEDEPVSILKLGRRYHKALSLNEIFTIGQLVSNTAEDLLLLRHVGWSAITAVRGALDALGLKLKGD